MGRIYSIIGKSATGKDTVYREVMRTKELNLHKFVQYTTRPIRAGEENGVQYYFVSGDEQKALEKSGRIVELRAYHTVQGVWKDFTVDDGQIDLEHHDYLNLCTLESYSGIREYFGRENVIAPDIEVADDLRISSVAGAGTEPGASPTIMSCAGDSWRIRRIFPRKTSERPESPSAFPTTGSWRTASGR